MGGGGGANDFCSASPLLPSTKNIGNEKYTKKKFLQKYFGTKRSDIFVLLFHIFFFNEEEKVL